MNAAFAGDALRSFRPFAADIKLAHSIFALPFAMAAFPLGGLPVPTLRQLALVVLCMVGARTFAMGMNRVLDREVDATNPRTRGRGIPRGALTVGQGLAWSLAAAALFVVAASALSPLAGYCALPLLGVLLLYSLMKRLTWLTHWYLGFCLGLAPIGVQIALTGTASPAVLLLGVAVCFWTAGFDVLYALQDLEFDRVNGLYSVPRRFGPRRSLWISRASFALMVMALASAGVLAGAGRVYYGGVAAVAALLAYEHFLVRDACHDGKSRHLGVAFFNLNAYVSVVFFVFAELDWLVR
jgi:4-hydroxybenzoate polyprenyltransferase